MWPVRGKDQLVESSTLKDLLGQRVSGYVQKTANLEMLIKERRHFYNINESLETNGEKFI